MNLGVALMTLVTRERIKELFLYSKKTGLFTRKIECGGQVAGTISGSLCKNGRLLISIDKKRYYAHRLAYFYVTGKWPIEVDHEDHIPTNNKWNNLRPVNRMGNCSNASRYKNNTSGHVGVKRVVSGNWTSYINHNKKESI